MFQNQNVAQVFYMKIFDGIFIWSQTVVFIVQHCFVYSRYWGKPFLLLQKRLLLAENLLAFSIRPSQQRFYCYSFYFFMQQLEYSLSWLKHSFQSVRCVWVSYVYLKVISHFLFVWRLNTNKRQGKFNYIAHFIHVVIQSALNKRKKNYNEKNIVTTIKTRNVKTLKLFKIWFKMN